MLPPEGEGIRVESIAEELRHIESMLQAQVGAAAKAFGVLQSVSARVDTIAARVDDCATHGDLDDLARQLAAASAALSDQVESWGERLLEAILGAPAVSARLIITNPQGDPEPMPSQITVDTVDETIILQWVDDKGNTDAAAPTAADGSAAVISFPSSDEAVATADASGAITVVGEGEVAFSLGLASSDGGPIFQRDGVTPFPLPDPVSLTVTAGAAVGARLSVNNP